LFTPGKTIKPTLTMEGLNAWSKVRAPASAQVSLVAPETEQPGSAVFIEAVVSTMSMTLADFPTPPLTPAVAVAVIVLVECPTNPPKTSGIVACCDTTMALALSAPAHDTPVLVRHFNFG
jgi:hypothetical protein